MRRFGVERAYQVFLISALWIAGYSPLLKIVIQSYGAPSFFGNTKSHLLIRVGELPAL